MHAVQYSPAVGGPSAAPAPVWKTSGALMQRHDTDQLASTIHDIGFTLVGGVRVRCKRSKAWWTWDSLPSPIFHGTSVPCKGNTGERSVQPMIPSRGAITTCGRKIRRASQEHESALVRSSVVEEEASAGKAAVPQAVGQCGDNWHLCKEMWVHAYRQALPTFGNNTNNRIECHNQKNKNYLSSSMHLVQAIEALVGYIDNDSLSLQFSKLNEMKLNLNINDFNDPFQLELSRNCTSEATSKVLEQYEKFKNVSYQVTSTPNSYVVVSPRSQYSVSLCLASCTCAFYNQYTLPCAHILAVRDFTKQDLFDKACIPDR
nr:uncharacterized protein LOC119169886 [Rhipicephalus microplus]